MANRKRGDIIIVSDVTEKLANVPYPWGASYAEAALVERAERKKSPRVMSDYGGTLSSYKQKATAAEQVYDNCPLVKSAVDMFVDLVFHRLVIRHSDPEVEKVFIKAFGYSNIEDAVQAILLDYFKYGNAFPYRFEGETIEDPFDEQFADFTPFEWINLDPVKVNIDGDYIDQIEYSMEKVFAGGGADSALSVSDSSLDQEAIYHIFAKKPVRQRKADPPLAALARAVDLYSAMYDALMSNMEDAIPGFVHARVGGLAGRAPKPQTIANVTSTIREAKTKSVVVTSDVVEMESIKVETPSISPDLYNAIIQQIEFGLGVSRELVTSSVQGGGSLQWFNITKLIKSLESVRRKLQKWLDREVRYITISLQEAGMLPDGMDEPPLIAFDEISLKDETRIRDILLKMYEKGMISDRTVIEEAKLDFMVELNRRALEQNGTFKFDGKELPISEILVPPAQPFQGDTKGGDTGGRPTDTNTEQKVNREAG